MMQRKLLPAWIREGLEKVEKEKQKELQKENEKKDESYAAPFDLAKKKKRGRFVSL